MATPNFLCPICSKVFPNNTKFKAHIAKVHAVDTAYKCNLCRKEFINRSSLKSHVIHAHEGVPYAQKKNFKCNLCDFEIWTENRLIDHMRKHTGERPFNCTAQGCDLAFKLELTLKNHIKYKHSNERPLKCKFRGCPYRAKTSATLIGHMKVHSDYRPFACPNAGCSFRARERSHVTRHERSVHSEAKKFACSICNHRSARADQLKYHMRRHTTIRDFKCSHPKCKKSFKSSVDLKRHLSNRHGERNVQCDEPGCSRRYATANALYKHKWDVHSKKKLARPNLNCSYSTNKPTLFKCPVAGCSWYAFTEKTLNRHMKLHNPSDRPFQCPLCFKHFSTRHQLKVHSVVHTKEKPLACGHCEYGSFTRAHVKAHISLVHANLKFPFMVFALGDRECLDCKVTLPLADFVVHSMSHFVPVVVMERLETIRS